ncbi:MAG TPA: discoidin domain-containing protein [Luteibacter sp.]|uniref:discoidin domain-containing protein n=1 Tax=Luteibacter sp. TaxID=1886636 RepID=UPI002CB01686|nr:discoidin domain-containing protein [Luteibacter sp.]HVI53594.1 discoidin domain-containing protein [Luteibacter sp.]
MSRFASLVPAVAACLLAVPAFAAGQTRMLDSFDATTGWSATHTDDVSAALRVAPGRDRQALCLTYDFHGVSGAASIRRMLPIDFPDGFALSFDVRGSMPPNTLQLKLIDDSGDNVWWFQQPHFVPGDAWKPVEATSRQVEFAWGPVKDRTLRHTRDIEFVVYAEAQPAQAANRGEVCFDNLRLTPRKPGAVAAPPPTPNAVFESRAKQERLGLYPRGFSGEQSYWTIVGVDGGSPDSALISEDGAVEIARGGFSIEPFLIEGGRLITWADVATTQSLRERYLPMPSVQWIAKGLRLDTTAFAQGRPGASQLVLSYRVTNDGDDARDVTLALAARPFQVNPPTQFLNAPGGTSPIRDLAWDGHVLTVNGAHKLIPLQATTAFVASANLPKTLTERLDIGERPVTKTLHDDGGFAQGALLYDVHVPAHGHVDLGVVVPVKQNDVVDVPADTAAWLASHADTVAAEWRDKLDRVDITVPASAQPIVDTMKSGIAHILISRDGPALQPGTRSYSRTWVRDGAMMLEGLLRTGHEDVASAFIRWYAPHQFSNGKVPCCVDARGSDPVPENDSHGELIFSVAELWRYTHDRATVDALWPHVEKAVAYMDALRASERHPARLQGADRPLYGLMPASISHEGYSTKPMHSYWDDFWALKGYDDAVELASALGHGEDVVAYSASRDAFRGDLHASIEAAVKAHGIDFIPGSAELGDFDATSTTIALSPGGEQARLPRALVDRTFERYWQGFVARRDGKAAWEDYTPYEVRTIATFVRLGWRDRVGDLIAFFFADRRPAAWNQWAEVVGHDARKPRFVGDMPHAWIASDFVRSALDLFAYAREADGSMVLAAGVQPAWLEGKGIAVCDLRTPYGRLGYTLVAKGGQVTLTLTQSIHPPGGLVLSLPSGELKVPANTTTFKAGL